MVFDSEQWIGMCVDRRRGDVIEGTVQVFDRVD
jgi:hypothetical protein